MRWEMLLALVVASLGCSKNPMHGIPVTDGALVAFDGVRDMSVAREASPSEGDAPRFDEHANGIPVADGALVAFDGVRDMSVAREASPSEGDAPRFDERGEGPVADVASVELGADGLDADSREPAERPLIEGQGKVSCRGAPCTNATGPCCPTTDTMSRVAYCALDCATPTIACDGPEDCSDNLVCCSVESATTGFAGAACVSAGECASPSRVICHERADCPSPLRCATPNPAPAAVYQFSEPGEKWLVDYLVCAP